jgi:hypothetical protein
MVIEETKDAPWCCKPDLARLEVLSNSLPAENLGRPCTRAPPVTATCVAGESIPAGFLESW